MKYFLKAFFLFFSLIPSFSQTMFCPSEINLVPDPATCQISLQLTDFNVPSADVIQVVGLPINAIVNNGTANPIILFGSINLPEDNVTLRFISGTIANPTSECSTKVKFQLNENNMPCTCVGNTNPLDVDKDFICDSVDNCPTVFNPSQADLNDDGQGDACDNTHNNNVVVDVSPKAGTLILVGSSGEKWKVYVDNQGRLRTEKYNF